MNRIPVTSSNLKSVAHDGAALEVEFKNGTIYRYDGVTPEEFAALRDAESPGQHFHQNIRGRDYVRVNPPQDAAGG